MLLKLAIISYTNFLLTISFTSFTQVRQLVLAPSFGVIAFPVPPKILTEIVGNACISFT